MDIEEMKKSFNITNEQLAHILQNRLGGRLQKYFMIQPAVFTAKSTRLHCNQSIVKNSTRIYKHAVRSVGGPYIVGYDTR